MPDWEPIVQAALADRPAGLDFHNRQRRHSSLGMLSPIEYERRHTPIAQVQAS